MKDSSVRPAHSALEGTTVAIDDPFLDTHMTPLDPNCRCWWEQTRELATNTDNLDFTPNPEWTGNPGKTGEVFNNQNSYNQKVEDNTTQLEIRKSAELFKEHLPYNRKIEVGDNTVFVNDFADMSDLEQNIAAAKKLAKALEKNIYIRHHIEGGIVKGHKNPELSIGNKSNTGDLKTYNGGSKFTNFIKNAIRSVNTQGGFYAVLNITKQSDLSDLNRTLTGSLNNQNSNIKRIILIKGDKVVEITRKQINNRDYSALEDL